MVEFNNNLLSSSKTILKLATVADVAIIRNLAERIWPPTFSSILTPDQIQYMLNWMYSEEELSNQIQGDHSFFLIIREEIPVGFIGLQPDFPQRGILKIHKLYVLPELQGLGLGKLGIQKACMFAKEKACSQVLLNVNRYNKAVNFYQYCGFVLVKQEDIAIGNGFLMEDYVMLLQVDDFLQNL